jgi:multicomponent K+:H+ antiporter subunit A
VEDAPDTLAERRAVDPSSRMLLFLIVVLPLLGALLPAWFIRWGRGPSALAAGVATAVPLVLLGSLAPRVLAGEVIRASVDWIPQAGVNLSFMLDGLGLLFAGLVLGIGLLVVIYARYYLSSSDPMGRFYSFLLLFMGAMLGVVLAENVIVLAVFWELTSLSSFLLIGFWSHLPAARQGARMALTVTGLGGLALLGGVVLLGTAAGSFELGEILARGPQIREHALYLPALLLILGGAFTKSAQFPFHFWLPRAMAAPTPVSAYLHSATMVKAGVFLLARFHPALAGSPAWFYIVGTTGMVTMVLGAYLANQQNDLKGLLAYSTISHLGLITALFGFGTQAAAEVAVFHILNHAAFKASLFMNAGIIDHQVGTRDLRSLGGLRALMPVTAVLAVVTSAAMAGLPPLNGFISKELFLEESLHLPFGGVVQVLFPVLATAGAAFSVAYSVRYVLDVFWGKRPESFPRAPVEPPRAMLAPVALLALLCILLGLVPNPIAASLLQAAGSAVTGVPLEAPHYYLWHGFTLPLAMSGIAIAGGVLLWRGRHQWNAFHTSRVPLPDAKRIFDAIVDGGIRAATTATNGLANGSLQRYLAMLLLTVVAVIGWPLLQGGIGAAPEGHSPLNATVASGFVMLIIGLVGAVANHHRRLTSLVFLSVVGLVTTLGFVHFSAPDLALTQITVEFVTIILLLLALHLLPVHTPRESTAGRKLRDWSIAGAMGTVMGVLTWMMLARRPIDPISAFHLAASKPSGGGTNVVNVILVDFRGFDTFGEVTVLGIAALGIYALIDGLGIPAKWRRSALEEEQAHPVMLVVAARVLFPVALLVGLYIFLRGHNHPGGGFIAGLIVAVAIILQYLANGIGWTQDRMRLDLHPVIATGIFVAGLAGVGAWVFGRPFLTSWYDYFEFPLIGKFELASAIVFDIGVFLTVVGAVLLTLVNLAKLPESTAVTERRNSKEAP